MSELEVNIVRLEPMQVASAYGYGPQPEEIAANKMVAYLKAKGLLDEYGKKYQHFGFNNPSPSVGSPNYGYEVWVTVPPGIEPEGDIRIVSFTGGLYAVTRFTNLNNIGDVWSALVKWRETSPYKAGHHQWLENLLNPLEKDPSRYMFDLYLPVIE